MLMEVAACLNIDLASNLADLRLLFMYIVCFLILWKSRGALILQKRKHDGDEDLNDVHRHKKNKVI